MSNTKNTDTQDNDAQQNNTVTKRRNFLKKAAVGATIASIPSHSVWAGRLISGNMSGNVSGWAQEQNLAIRSHGFYKNPNHQGYGQATLFSTAFGGEPIANLGKNPMPTGLTLLDVMQSYKINGENGNKTGGPGNVNCQLATMYLNALNHSMAVKDGIVHWPVVSQTGPYYNIDDYADDIYKQALLNPISVGASLAQIICTYGTDPDACVVD